MTNNILDTIPALVFAFILFLTILAFAFWIPEAKAEDLVSSDEYMNYIFDTGTSKKVYSYLKQEGYVKDSVDWEDFDTIYVLTRQICEELDVKPSLILAMIAQESNFDKDAKNQSAVGLMQLIPLYTEDRMEKYLEEGVKPNLDHFYTPRYNIVTGVDYMSYILGETNGDVSYALMWYNQGAVSAFEDHINNGYTSYYANNVQRLAKEIQNIIRDDLE